MSINNEGQAFGAMAKVYATESMFKTVYECLQVVGINSLDKLNPMQKYLREAALFPLYDAGNIGMQRRKIWGVMADAAFDPRALTDSKEVPFKKSMEGMGLETGYLPAGTIIPDSVPVFAEV